MVLMKKLVFKEIELQGIEGTKSSTIVPVHLIANYFKQDLLFSNQILQQYCILVGKSFLTKAISPVLKKLTSKQKTYEVCKFTNQLIINTIIHRYLQIKLPRKKILNSM